MTPTPVVLPDDLIAELLSFLPVKTLVQFKCVSKSWKNLISNSKFVKLHLNRSQSRNPLFTLITSHQTHIPCDDNVVKVEFDYSVVPYSMRSLIENPSFTVSIDPYYHVKDKGGYHIVGTCNGLILLAHYFTTSAYIEYRLGLWNPTTRTIFQEFGYFCDFCNSPNAPLIFHGHYKFMFGCDNSTDTYKVVASRYNPHQMTSNVRILSLRDYVWRDIESFPVIPLHLDDRNRYGRNVGVYLSGTINWLAIQNDFHYNFKDITIEQFVIVSLDLGTETYNQYLLPRGFHKVPHVEPIIGVLGGCLSFSYSYKKAEFVIWQMQKFGVEESWTQFLRISYQDLQIEYRAQLVPLLLSEDASTLILGSSKEFHPILYNWKDNRVERIKMTTTTTITDNRTKHCICWYAAKVYVESLVSII